MDFNESVIETLNTLTELQDVSDRADKIERMMELEALYGPASVPKRFLEDRMNPLERFNRPGEFK